ncbi:MAG: peptidase S10 [Saprospiraceae bacterium]
MKHCNITILIMTLLVLNVSNRVNGQEKSTPILPIPKLETFTAHGKVSNGGKIVNYTSIAKESFLKNSNGDSIASIWSVSYSQDGVTDLTTRPVMFVFNGGPGSASVWLHMGMFGPKIVAVDSDANIDDGAAPYVLKENIDGILDLTDLVFVDPVGTGYSRVVGKGKVEDFWGLNEDAASIAQFMRLWVTENHRWLSPKYIAGESFGTTRAVAVASALEGGGQDMALNGLILISQALDYAGSTSDHDNITSYLTYLPAMAATAWYHKKAGIGKTLTSFLDECRAFTYDVYTPALYRGNLLSDLQKDNIASKLHYFTGLKKTYIVQSDLRILIPRFQKQLLADEGLAIGRLDGRYKGEEGDKVSESPHLGDAASYQISSAYTAALNHYFATDLKVSMDRPYLTSNRQIGKKWRWRTVSDDQAWEPWTPNVARKLGETMRRNTQMKVLVASGYYDLICPFFDAEYTFARNDIVKSRVTMTYYEAGHMMYTHQPDLKKLAADIRKFLVD